MRNKGLIAGVIFFLILSVIPAFYHASAQNVECNSYTFPGYSQGWRVNTGTISAQNVNGYFSSLDTPAVDVDLILGVDRAIYSVTVNTYHPLLATYGAVYARMITYDVNNNVTGFKAIINGEWGWHQDTAYFRGERVRKLSIKLEALQSISTGVASTTALNVASICTYGIGTQTPTFTPSETGAASNTPDPSITPTETLTPTATLTATMSLTPTQTFTPTVTDTATAGPSPTPGPSLPPSISGRGLFPTVIAPNGCADVFNPCGALPFAVPKVPTISLPTHAPYTSVPCTPSQPCRSATVITPVGTIPPGTTTPGGTPGGTATPGTGTPNPTYNALRTITNGINGQAGTLVAMGSGGGVGIGGTPQGIGDGASAIGENAGLWWGYVRGIGLHTQNKVFDLIWFLILCVLFVFIVRIAMFIMPIVIGLIKFVINLFKAIPFV